MKTIDLQKLLNTFNGNKSSIAKTFGVTRQAVNYWYQVGYMPKLRVYETQDIIADILKKAEVNENEN